MAAHPSALPAIRPARQHSCRSCNRRSTWASPSSTPRPTTGTARSCWAGRCAGGATATLQVSYSILQQEPGADLLPAAAAQGLGLIIKQPVANGIPDLAARPAHLEWAAKWDVAQRLNWPGLGAADGRLALALRWV